MPFSVPTLSFSAYHHMPPVIFTGGPLQGLPAYKTADASKRTHAGTRYLTRRKLFPLHSSHEVPESLSEEWELQPQPDDVTWLSSKQHMEA